MFVKYANKFLDFLYYEIKQFSFIRLYFKRGGYYTNWNFSSNFFEKYLYTLKSLPITFTEIGYISDIKDQKGPFYHLDNNLIKIAKSKLRKDQKVLAMINFKEIKNSKHLEKLIT